MEDALVNLMFTHFPIIGICVTIIILSNWLTWWGRGWLLESKNKFTKVQAESERIDADCRKNGDDIKRIDTAVKNNDNDTKRIEADVKKCEVDNRRTEAECKKNEMAITRVEGDHRQLDKSHQGLSAKVDRIESKLDGLIVRFDALAGSFYGLISNLNPMAKEKHDMFLGKSPIELTDVAVNILNEMGGKTYVDNNLVVLLDAMEKQDFKSGLDVQNYCVFCFLII
jgi:hypothetical protein